MSTAHFTQPLRRDLNQLPTHTHQPRDCSLTSREHGQNFRLLDATPLHSAPHTFHSRALKNQNFPNDAKTVQHTFSVGVQIPFHQPTLGEKKGAVACRSWTLLGAASDRMCAMVSVMQSPNTSSMSGSSALRIALSNMSSGTCETVHRHNHVCPVHLFCRFTNVSPALCTCCSPALQVHTRCTCLVYSLICPVNTV